MRISDWSSDVCSSDLLEVAGLDAAKVESIDHTRFRQHRPISGSHYDWQEAGAPINRCKLSRSLGQRSDGRTAVDQHAPLYAVDGGVRPKMAIGRSEERRVGNECVSTCRSRWSQTNETKKPTNKTAPH